MKMIHCALNSNKASITNAEKRVPKSAAGTGADEAVVIPVRWELEHRMPVGDVFENLLMWLTQVLDGHGIDDRTAFAVMIGMRHFFEELVADLNQLRISLGQVAEDTECAADIVHRWRSAKR